MITDSRIAELMSAEVDMFVRSHPRSQEESTRSQSSLLAGVPMPWMKRWAGPFPVIADRAVGGSIVDIDGNTYVDFCLGDTGSMTGHANAPISQAIADARRVTKPSSDCELLPPFQTQACRHAPSSELPWPLRRPASPPARRLLLAPHLAHTAPLTPHPHKGRNNV